MLKRRDGLPRRCDLQLLTPAEIKIRDAIAAVEELGADVALTNAVIALTEAARLVADVVDRRLTPPTSS